MRESEGSKAHSSNHEGDVSSNTIRFPGAGQKREREPLGPPRRWRRYLTNALYSCNPRVPKIMLEGGLCRESERPITAQARSGWAAAQTCRASAEGLTPKPAHAPSGPVAKLQRLGRCPQCFVLCGKFHELPRAPARVWAPAARSHAHRAGAAAGPGHRRGGQPPQGPLALPQGGAQGGAGRVQQRTHGVRRGAARGAPRPRRGAR
jgi:hypothetical protein